MNNLPPGVSDSEIPGNGPLDAVAERYPEAWSEEQVRVATCELCTPPPMRVITEATPAGPRRRNV